MRGQASSESAPQIWNNASIPIFSPSHPHLQSHQLHSSWWVSFVSGKWPSVGLRRYIYLSVSWLDHNLRCGCHLHQRRAKDASHLSRSQSCGKGPGNPRSSLRLTGSRPLCQCGLGRYPRWRSPLYSWRFLPWRGTVLLSQKQDRSPGWSYRTLHQSMACMSNQPLGILRFPRPSLVDQCVWP